MAVQDAVLEDRAVCGMAERAGLPGAATVEHLSALLLFITRD
jgi:hypothetical protein